MKAELVCQECSKKNNKVRYIKEFKINLCETCNRTYINNPIKYIPPDGEIHYDDEGKVICHECGRSYHKLSTHLIGKHKISSKEYKRKHGLNNGAKLTSKSLQEKFKNNPSVDIAKVRKTFKKGHTINKGVPKRLQAIKNRMKKMD